MSFIPYTVPAIKPFTLNKFNSHLKKLQSCMFIWYSLQNIRQVDIVLKIRLHLCFEKRDNNWQNNYEKWFQPGIRHVPKKQAAFSIRSVGWDRYFIPNYVADPWWEKTYSSDTHLNHICCNVVALLCAICRNWGLRHMMNVPLANIMMCEDLMWPQFYNTTRNDWIFQSLLQFLVNWTFNSF